MAYFNQDNKKEMAPKIKNVLNKYGIKGTISVRNNMVLVVTLKSGKLDILQNYLDNFNIQAEYKDYPKLEKPPEYIDVNTYHVDSYYSGIVKDFLNELITVMNIGNHNNNDIMTDYFDVGWYIDINVGKWNKPYQFEA
jgi:ABC-type proline/glycine betaine transport system substrate-binding protein